METINEGVVNVEKKRSNFAVKMTMYVVVVLFAIGVIAAVYDVTVNGGEVAVFEICVEKVYGLNPSSNGGAELTLEAIRSDKGVANQVLECVQDINASNSEY